MLILLFVSANLLLFKLGGSRLAPWDEAWYATIGRNILRTGSILDLSFNGKPFWDHPPLAFILEAISFFVLGVSEFSARLPMALSGILAVFLVYLTAKKQAKDKWAGIIAGLILLSSRWFLIRARTANIEALLLLSQLVIFYFSYTARKSRDLTILWLVFGLSLTVKSVISITLLPLVLIATFVVWHKERRVSWNFIWPFAVVAFPWYIFNYLKYGWSFIERNIFHIALRGGGGYKTGKEELAKTILYFRSAVHKWYWPSLISSLWGLLKIGDHNFRWLWLYLLLVSLPYMASPTTEIWHLLPMIPAVSLMIAYAVKSANKLLPESLRSLFMLGAVLATVLVAFVSIRSYTPFLYQDFSESFEAKLAIASKEFSYPLYLQDTTYVPTVVFYADRPVELIWDDKNLVNTLPRPFQIITREHMLGEAKVEYEIVEKAGDTVLAIFK